MTHRVFSRNAASNRAIPFAKLCKEVLDDPFVPLVWGSNKPGMQGGDEIAWPKLAEYIWRGSRYGAIAVAHLLSKLGLHKQVVNRLLNPWQHINVIVTATDWNNFFKLRLAEDVEPHMRMLAEAIKEAIDNAPIAARLYHVPYLVDSDHYSGYGIYNLSAARCARVSYNNHDQTIPNPKKDHATAILLKQSGHLTPFEHQAKAQPGRWANFEGWISQRYQFE